METFSSSKKQSWLSWFFRGVLVIGLLVILTRLFELQVIKGNYFRNLAEGNRIRRISISAPRGKILARGGEVLAGNKQIKKGLIYDDFEGYKKTDSLEGLSGEEIVTDHEREYEIGELAGHLTGYLGEVNESEVGKINPKCFFKGILFSGQLVGRSGLEEEYECTLSGIDGEELIEVDSSGKKIRTLGTRKPIAGKDIKTTIHLGLQKKLAESFEGKKGAGVVTDTKGEVLAYFSSPSFDPNIFIKGENSKITKLIEDEDSPFFNRVIGGAFHPGSVFKPFVSIGALEEEVIDENYSFVDEGKIELKTLYGDYEYTNWYFTQYGGKEGEIKLPRALARSTDTFFYKVGELMGIKNIEKWSNKFKLSDISGIDLPGEIEGLIPNPDWKKKTTGEKWFLGNTYHLAIGQGDLLLTPLSINNAISAIASGGKYCFPRIVEDPNCTKLSIEEKNIELVKSGMVQACETGGTAFPFFNFSHKSLPESGKIACKTGTAETGKKDINHAWFTAFAPANLPEIVGTFLVVEGGEGSSVAAPIARQVFDYWFGVNKNP